MNPAIPIRIAALLAGAAVIHAALAPPTRIGTDGRFFVTGGRTFRPLFASALALLARTTQERAAVLDAAARDGFNGVRVFAGELGWAHQTPALARSVLPAALEQAEARGLYVYVSAITGSGSRYDVEAHLRAVAGTCAAAANCLLEIANEFYHPSQSRQVQDPVSLLALARRTVPPGHPYALGAAAGHAAAPNKGYPADGGAFITAHLDRGGDKWSQLGRVREIAEIGERTGKPAMSGEPIGAAESVQPGRRESDPAFFFALGALTRLFELGTVFHSEDGLHARPLGPTQQRCAVAFVAGFRSIDTDARLAFADLTSPESPVANAGKPVFIYSAVAGRSGWTVAVGVNGDHALRAKNGWRIDRVVSRRPGVRVLALQRR